MNKNLDCISTCDSLLKKNEKVLFLKQAVMGNEKWILYNNFGTEEIMGQAK